MPRLPFCWALCRPAVGAITKSLGPHSGTTHVCRISTVPGRQASSSVSSSSLSSPPPPDLSESDDLDSSPGVPGTQKEPRVVYETAQMLRKAKKEAREKRLSDPYGDSPLTNMFVGSKAYDVRIKSLVKTVHMDEYDARMRASIKRRMDTVTSFEELFLSDQVIRAIKEIVLSHVSEPEPSQIQKLVTLAILEEESKPRPQKCHKILFAAETGSGKTLAYLAPFFELLKRRELAAGKASQQQKQHVTPPALVLAPSGDLVNQIGSVAKEMSHIAKLRVAVVHPSDTDEEARRVLHAGRDLVVIAPAQLAKLIRSKSFDGRLVKYLAVDEADSMMLKGFSDDISYITGQLTGLRKLLFCSASIPRALDTLVKNRYPGTDILVSSKLHTIPRKIDFEMVDSRSGHNSNKRTSLRRTLLKIGRGIQDHTYKHNVLVFVNKKETVTELLELLAKYGYDAVGLSDNPVRRREIIKEFCEEPQPGPGVRVLVTTDVLARGIDTRTVKDVILYDVPSGHMDLIHRLGRTGRFKKRGRAWLIVKKEKNIRSWVRRFKIAHGKGLPLT